MWVILLLPNFVYVGERADVGRIGIKSRRGVGGGGGGVGRCGYNIYNSETRPRSVGRNWVIVKR